MANEIKIGADISGLTRELSRIDGITEKEAKKMVKALDRQMKRAEKSTKSAAKASKKAWHKAGQGVGSSLAGITPGLGKLQGSMAKIGMAAGPAGAAVAGMATVIAGAAVAVFKLADAASQYVDKVTIMAKKTGLTADSIVALEFAAGAAGGSLEKVEAGLAGFVAKLGSAELGSAKSIKAFSMIGVSLKDTGGIMRSTEDILSDTLLAISLLPTETEKATAATRLFGNSGAELIATLGEGGALFDEWREKTAGMIDDKALASSAAMDESLNNLAFSARMATVAYGSEFGEAIGSITDKIVVLTTMAAEAADTVMALGRVALVVKDLSGGMAGVAKSILTADGSTQNLIRSLGETTEATAAVVEVVDEEKQARIDALKATQDLFAEERTAAESARDDAKQAREDAKQQRADDKAAAASSRARAKAATAARKADADAAAALLKIEKDLAAEAKATADANLKQFQTDIDNGAQLVNMTMDYERTKLTAEEKILTDTRATFNKISELEAGRPALAEAAAEARVAVAAGANEQIAALHTAAASAQAAAYMDVSSQTAGALADLTGTLSAASGEHEALAVGMFRASQAASLAQVGIDTAAAITKGMAMYGPPPSPLGIAAIAAATITGAASAATIATQSPPSFHTGGVLQPDERMIKARAGEGVLTPQGVAAVGGRDGLDKLNTGRGGSAQQITIVNQYKHRVFDAFVTDNLQMASSPLRRAITGAIRVGQSRRQ